VQGKVVAIGVMFLCMPWLCLSLQTFLCLFFGKWSVCDGCLLFLSSLRLLPPPLLPLLHGDNNNNIVLLIINLYLKKKCCNFCL